ncbi:MAG: hypothetical protein LBL59_00365 [Xanthomonadaceae bacterium]|jgi:hypothetical protein|nr:hypothetical protein [Xanthomonadaceae bacterium]
MLFPLNFFRLHWVAWGIAALAVSGCAGITAKPDHPASGKAEFSLEQLLSLPVQQGRAGLDQVTDFLHRQYAAYLRNGEISSLDTQGELVLADGYILEDASTFVPRSTPGGPEWSPDVTGIYFTVSKTPCFPLERFVQISGAQAPPPGVDPPDYTLYDYRGDEVNMSASVSYPDFKCIRSVNMAVN